MKPGWLKYEYDIRSISAWNTKSISILETFEDEGWEVFTITPIGHGVHFNVILRKPKPDLDAM